MQLKAVSVKHRVVVDLIRDADARARYSSRLGVRNRITHEMWDAVTKHVEAAVKSHIFIHQCYTAERLHELDGAGGFEGQ